MINKISPFLILRLAFSCFICLALSAKSHAEAPDTQEIHKVVKHALLLRHSDPAKMISMLLPHKKYIPEQDIDLQFNYYNALYFAYGYTDKINESLHYADKILRLPPGKHEEDDEYFVMLMNKAILHLKKDEFQKVDEIHIRFKRIAQDNGNNLAAILDAVLTAVLATNQGRFKVALRELHAANTLLDQHRGNFSSAQIELGFVRLIKSEYIAAIEYFNPALATKYLQELLELHIKLNDPSMQILNYEHMARLHIDAGELEQARQSTEALEQVAKTHNRPQGLYFAYLLKSRIALHHSKLENAATFLLRASLYQNSDSSTIAKRNHALQETRLAVYQGRYGEALSIIERSSHLFELSERRTRPHLEYLSLLAEAQAGNGLDEQAHETQNRYLELYRNVHGEKKSLQAEAIRLGIMLSTDTGTQIM
jgi:ATP/maltotriose-dependent transcriptional regulator MalT